MRTIFCQFYFLNYGWTRKCVGRGKGQHMVVLPSVCVAVHFSKISRNPPVSWQEPKQVFLFFNWWLITKILTITGVVFLCHFGLLLLDVVCVCVQALEVMQQLFFVLLVTGLAQESCLCVLPFFWVVPLTSPWTVSKRSGGFSLTCFSAQGTAMGDMDKGCPCFSCSGKLWVCTWGHQTLKTLRIPAWCRLSGTAHCFFSGFFSVLFLLGLDVTCMTGVCPRYSNQARSPTMVMPSSASLCPPQGKRLSH